MKFLYPTFLYALFVLAIPLLIHFFNFKKYKTLYFSNVHILKTLKQESKKKSKLKQLLILLARLTALAAFVLAFSRPYIPLNNRIKKSAQQHVAIYVDNSFSMKANGESGPLFDLAKNKAMEIANSYPSGTSFILLTNDFSPEHQHYFNKEQFIEQLSSLKQSPVSVTFSKVYQQGIKKLVSEEGRKDKTLYCLSDFQQNNSDLNVVKSDSSIWTYLLPFEATKVNNLYIDSCWFETPGRKIQQQERLFVRVNNMSDQAYQNVPIRLMINDSLRAVATIHIDAYQNETIELNYTNKKPGIHLCEVSLDDYPITYDNSYFFSYQVHHKIDALGIYNPENNGSIYLNALFKNDEFVDYNEMPERNVLISRIKDYQCIYLINLNSISSGLKNELVSFVDQGGTLVVFPDLNGDFESYNSMLRDLNCTLIQNSDTSTVPIAEINYNNLIYKEAFKRKEKEANLPVINGFIRYQTNYRSPETELLSFRNGEKALSQNEFGIGKVYNAAFSLDASNIRFAKHIIFVPTVYNLALNSTEPQSYSTTINMNDEMQTTIKIGGSIPTDLQLRNNKTNDQFLMASRPIGFGRYQISFGNIVKDAGHYILENADQVIRSFSFNYSRSESALEYYSIPELKNQIENNKLSNIQIIEATTQTFSETLKELNNGKQLWKFFIGLTLIFVLCEALIIRFWK